MDKEEVLEWAEKIKEFHAHFSHLFKRSESRNQSLKYMKGLLTGSRRKNAWQIAEVTGDALPDPTQRLLNRVEWDEEEAIANLQGFTTIHFGEPDGVLVVDNSDFPKKGMHSVGVQRQHCGTLGKVDNCQSGVFLGYASSKGHVLIDRHLFLPEAWCDDPHRRKKAKIPEDLKFQTKPEIASALLIRAVKNGIPAQWVTSDTLYGDSPVFRKTVEELKLHAVLGIKKSTHVWENRPRTVKNRRKKGRGRPGRRRLSLASNAPPSKAAGEIIERQNEKKWIRISVGDGEKGPKEYDWCRVRVVEKRHGIPGKDAWLLARRSIEKPEEIKYFLCFAPLRVSMKKLAEVASYRWTVEQCFEESKGETGLDEYEVRLWRCWHRHITLSMMAHTFLAWLKYIERKKKSMKNLLN